MPEPTAEPPIMQPREGYVYTGSSTCGRCPATIRWWRTTTGRSAPFDDDGTSHFATCPAAQSFRRPRKETPNA